MWLFCLGKFGRLAEGRDNWKIFVAIATPAAYTCKVCEQSFLSAPERGGRQARPTASRACRIIGAGQKFSQDRPSEKTCAVAPQEWFTNQFHTCR